MRLIDADELERKVSRLCPKLSTPDGTGPDDGLVFAAQDILIDVMQVIHDAPTIAPPPNELRGMDGELVWVVPITSHVSEGWMLVNKKWCCCKNACGDVAFFERYGEWWLAYRCRPKGTA